MTIEMQQDDDAGDAIDAATLPRFRNETRCGDLPGVFWTI